MKVDNAQVIRSFRRIAGAVPLVGREAVEDTATEFASDLRRTAPIGETGGLQASVGEPVITESGRGTAHRVRASVTIAADYAKPVESYLSKSPDREHWVGAAQEEAKGRLEQLAVDKLRKALGGS